MEVVIHVLVIDGAIGVDKARVHVQEGGVDPENIVESRLLNNGSKAW